jgi:hypothetical protein
VDQSISQLKQKSSKVGPKGLIIFGLVFTAAGALFLSAFFVPMVVGVVRSRNWVATPCVMVTSQVEESSSGDDGPTYRINARYRYVWDDHERSGDRYNWSTGYTSGYAGKQEIVNRLRPGAETTCYVNPANPAESVLDRDLNSDAFYGLIPLVFVVVGLAIVFYGMRSRSAAISDAAAGPGGRFGRRFGVAGRRANGWVATLPIPNYDRGPMELRPVGKPRESLVVLAIIATVWNGSIGWILSSQVLGAGRMDPFRIVSIVFLGVFALAGLFLIGLFVFQVMWMRNPTPTVTLSKSIIRLGDSLEVGWKLDGRTDSISVLTLALEGREIATSMHGQKDGCIRKHLFAKVEVARVAGPITSATGRATLRVPEKSMPSFHSAHNRIQWVLVVRGEIPYCPDMKEEFTLDIYGPDVKVVLDGPAD